MYSLFIIKSGIPQGNAINPFILNDFIFARCDSFPEWIKFFTVIKQRYVNDATHCSSWWMIHQWSSLSLHQHNKQYFLRIMACVSMCLYRPIFPLYFRVASLMLDQSNHSKTSLKDIQSMDWRSKLLMYAWRCYFGAYFPNSVWFWRW